MMSDKQSSKAVLHSVERTILERAYMEYRPFGVDERGARITDVSGMIVLDNVEFLKHVPHGERAMGPRPPDGSWKSCAGC